MRILDLQHLYEVHLLTTKKPKFNGSLDHKTQISQCLRTMLRRLFLLLLLLFLLLLSHSCELLNVSDITRQSMCDNCQSSVVRKCWKCSFRHDIESAKKDDENPFIDQVHKNMPKLHKLMGLRFMVYHRNISLFSCIFFHLFLTFIE